jgi:hypothetical protein
MKWLKNNWFEVLMAIVVLYIVDEKFNVIDKFKNKVATYYAVKPNYRPIKNSHQPREMVNKVARIEQDGRETFSFTSGSRPLLVRLEVQSKGAPVDFFIATYARYKETMLELRNRKRDGVYMETHEVIATEKEVILPANGSYTLGIRHADGPINNLFNKNEPSAIVSIKFYFIDK